MIAEGTYRARPVRATTGVNKRGEPVVVVRFELLEGPDVGQRINWNGQVTEKAKKWTALGLKALGWSGKDFRTAPQEIAARPLDVPIVITHYEPKDGKQPFATVRSVGIQEMPDLDELTDGESKAATRMLLLATEEADGKGPPPPGDDDIPF